MKNVTSRLVPKYNAAYRLTSHVLIGQPALVIDWPKALQAAEYANLRSRLDLLFSQQNWLHEYAERRHGQVSRCVRELQRTFRNSTSATSPAMSTWPPRSSSADCNTRKSLRRSSIDPTATAPGCQPVRLLRRAGSGPFLFEFVKSIPSGEDDSSLDSVCTACHTSRTIGNRPHINVRNLTDVIRVPDS